jgi:hypothetical protein
MEAVDGQALLAGGRIPRHLRDFRKTLRRAPSAPVHGGDRPVVRPL